ncbi:M28 family peptidase [Falsiroseomonas stagni]|uniref:PA domain-containing protein n=1 Tax=Falsiroseomonas stagni DSM 19981 TaxID=1123062 RepID=A0A1I4D342_9PROT|nr:M28 family peptidase [Falsiroseomonas stagni]SFK86606.1 PA domain-containing protein [Falsiroseomonas stagni DSM 19981]
MTTSAEQAVMNTAVIDHAWSLVECFSAMRRQDPGEAAAAGEEIARRLAALGLPVTVHRPRLYLAVPRDAHVTLGGQRFRARPAQLAQTAPGGLAAKLVFVENPIGPPAGWTPGTAALFGDGYDPAPGVPDVTGKIVLFRGMILAEKILHFAALGAAGVIAVNPGPDMHWGSGSAIWGTPDLDDLPARTPIPGCAVSKPDGDALIAAASRGDSATLTTVVEEGWFDQVLPEVRIPGQEPDFALLHGHYDSWDVGVGDNATGDACMLEVARVIHANRQHLKRGVRICWWPGHSTGKFAGSTWYADEFARDLARHCVAHMNCDSPGCRDATDYPTIPWMAENRAFVTDAVRDATGKVAGGKRPTQSSDFSFNNLGISGCFSASSRIPKEEVERRGWYFVMGNGGNTAWHTDRDQMEVADPGVLLTDIRLYALALFRLATLPAVPLDPGALVADLQGHLARYAKAAGDRFDLSPAARAFDGLAAKLAAFEATNTDPALATRTRLAVLRQFVPLDYVRGTRYRRDIGLPAPPLTHLAVAAELDRYPPAALGFATTSLKRGLNHVLAAVEAAAEAIP